MCIVQNVFEPPDAAPTLGTRPSPAPIPGSSSSPGSLRRLRAGMSKGMRNAVPRPSGFVRPPRSTCTPASSAARNRAPAPVAAATLASTGPRRATSPPPGVGSEPSATVLGAAGAFAPTADPAVAGCPASSPPLGAGSPSGFGAVGAPGPSGPGAVRGPPGPGATGPPGPSGASGPPGVPGVVGPGVVGPPGGVGVVGSSGSGSSGGVGSVRSSGSGSSAVEPSPLSDHGLTPSSFRARTRTWYVVSASSPVMVVLVRDPPRLHSVQPAPSASLYAMS